MKEYCTQNNGDCSTCSLVSYGRDCFNQRLDAEPETDLLAGDEMATLRRVLARRTADAD